MKTNGKILHIAVFGGHLYKEWALRKTFDAVGNKTGIDYTIIKAKGTKPTTDIKSAIDQFGIAQEGREMLIASHSLGFPTSIIATEGYDNIKASVAIAQAMEVGPNSKLEKAILEEKKRKARTPEEVAQIQKDYIMDKIIFTINCIPSVLTFKPIQRKALKILDEKQPTYPITLIRAINDETVPYKATETLMKHLRIPVDYYELISGGHDLFTADEQGLLVEMLSQIFTEQPVTETQKVKHMVL